VYPGTLLQHVELNCGDLFHAVEQQIDFLVGGLIALDPILEQIHAGHFHAALNEVEHHQRPVGQRRRDVAQGFQHRYGRIVRVLQIAAGLMLVVFDLLLFVLAIFLSGEFGEALKIGLDWAMGRGERKGRWVGLRGRERALPLTKADIAAVDERLRRARAERGEEE